VLAHDPRSELAAQRARPSEAHALGTLDRTSATRFPRSSVAGFAMQTSNRFDGALRACSNCRRPARGVIPHMGSRISPACVSGCRLAFRT
jgi:hypothetical protein